MLFSDADREFAEELSGQLAAVVRDFRGVLRSAGTEGLAEQERDELVALISSAPVVICLLSPNYLKSVLHTDLSIPDLLERRCQSEEQPLLVLPIVVRNVAVNALRWLNPARWFPEDRTPLRSKDEDDRDHILAELVEHIDQKREDAAFRMAPPAPAWPALSADAIRVERLPQTAEGPLGRDAELGLLDELWDQGTCNVVALVAAGGVGKTALVNRWVQDMGREHYRGAARVYAWSFYSQGTGERVTSADLFVDDTLRWFGDREAASSNLSAWDKGHRLAAAIRKERTLLVLDGLEPLQGSLGFENGEISDPALQTMLRDLAAENPGLVVITTREQIAGVEGPEVVQQNLEQVSREAVRALFRRAEIRGTDEECDRVGECFGFHVLAIHLLIPYLRGCPGRRVTFALQIPDLEGVSEEDGKHPRRVMEFQASQLGGTPELNLLHVLGLFDRIATGKELAYLKSDSTVQGLTDKLRFQTEKEWDRTIANLRALNLVSPPSHHDYDVTGEIIVAKDLRRVGALDAHPLVRTHFGQRLREHDEAAWKEGHRILYRCLTRVTPRFPETMQEMAPLYQAVAHGCQAGLHEEACVEVYNVRILRGIEHYSWRTFGAFGADLGAVACFFEAPWERLAPDLSEDLQGWLLAQAGLYLRGLGQLTEAVAPMRAATEAAVLLKQFDHAAASASNLSELYLTLGEVARAVAEAEQSMEFAGPSGTSDSRSHIVSRTTLADALHQSGERPKARGLFREAEAMQAEREPQHPLLYSLRGSQYCELLLTGAERVAWQTMSNAGDGVRHAEWLAVCREVEERGEQALKWGEVSRTRLLAVALSHLTLGRVALYLVLLGLSDDESEKPEAGGRETVAKAASGHLAAAVDVFRAAGTQHHLPRGLLSRAWLCFIEGDPDAARADLDEAWEIAERGSMRLHMADILLHRARLFQGRSDLLEARKLIEECGYGRRKEELEDAEEAARNWPT